MSKVRPSLILRMHVVESLANDQVKADFNRAYSYIAPSLMQLAEGRFANENTIEMQIVLHHSYWLAEEGADESWNEVMVPWLTNMFYKVSNNLVRCYANESGMSSQPVHFDWVEIDFPTVHVALKLGKDCSIPQIALEVAKHVRAMANDGSLGEGAQVVRVPSRASYEAQLAAAREVQAKAQAEAVVQEDAAGQAADATKNDDAEESANAQQSSAQEAADQSDERARSVDDAGTDTAEDEQAEQASEGSEQSEPVADPDFDIDYTTWGIEREDGTVTEITVAL